MKKADIPSNERERLNALRSLDILDTDPEERYDRLTRLAQRLLDVPIAMISLVDADRQWFKSRQGMDVSHTARDISFCGHAINEDKVFMISDTHKDDRFKDNPLVNEYPKIRFYAAYPLSAENGLKVGTFCVIDRKPRRFKDAEVEFLRNLGQMVESEMAQKGEVEAQLLGLSSARYFKSILKHLCDFSRDMNISVSVLKFKISNVDKIEKESGSISQDRFFVDMARLVDSNTRKSDLVGKLKDNVFYLVAPKCTKANLEIISSRLKKNFDYFLGEKYFSSDVDLQFKYFEYDSKTGSLEKLVASELIF